MNELVVIGIGLAVVFFIARKIRDTPPPRDPVDERPRCWLCEHVDPGATCPECGWHDGYRADPDLHPIVDAYDALVEAKEDLPSPAAFDDAERAIQRTVEVLPELLPLADPELRREDVVDRLLPEVRAHLLLRLHA